jgi:hypothetical protein
MIHKLVLATALLPLLGGAALAHGSGHGGGHSGHTAVESSSSTSQSTATADHSPSLGRQQMAQRDPNHYSGVPCNTSSPQNDACR